MPEKIRKPQHDRYNAAAPVSADPAPGYAADRDVQSGGPAADDVDFDGLLPEAPGHRPRLGWQR